ncbi:hypothetical protein N7493_009453 [Penicillium malachiteum]|uniref:Uncharacterized protein n=1 Tax=Penicillium malachiteum TaxID=1324776 RepID=A0AAD6HE73_9EURO|nr:hypothetical protein N7493_009453 [Penicillium malachiteum]
MRPDQYDFLRARWQYTGRSRDVCRHHRLLCPNDGRYLLAQEDIQRIGSARSPIRTFGSPERSWPKGHFLRDTELMRSHDDGVELVNSDSSQYTHLASPDSTSSLGHTNTLRPESAQGPSIIVQNRTTVSENVHLQQWHHNSSV